MIKTCSRCKKRIANKSVVAQGLFFHPECFTCRECGKPVKGSFNTKGTDFFHAECYQKKFRLYCAKCRKPLENKWVESSGRKYHETCFETHVQLKCTVCSKPIEGQYNHDEEGNYHIACFKAEKAPRCSVCREVLEGEYFIDLWDNKSHKKHNGIEPSFCGCCSRIISEATSKESTKYNDGRVICGICRETEIINQHQTVPSKLKVIEELKKVGLNYIPGFIKIDFADKITINKLLGTSMTNNTHGYTKTVFKRTNGIVTSKEHSITMLYGLPKLQFESVLAHELLHVWLHEKNLDMPAEETEGFCNLGAALILQNDKSKFSEILLKKLAEDPDKIYGDGYRMMKKKLEMLGWPGLIQEVLSYKPKLIKKVVE